MATVLTTTKLLVNEPADQQASRYCPLDPLSGQLIDPRKLYWRQIAAASLATSWGVGRIQ